MARGTGGQIELSVIPRNCKKIGWKNRMILAKLFKYSEFCKLATVCKKQDIGYPRCGCGCGCGRGQIAFVTAMSDQGCSGVVEGGVLQRCACRWLIQFGWPRSMDLLPVRMTCRIAVRHFKKT